MGSCLCLALAMFGVQGFGVRSQGLVNPKIQNIRNPWRGSQKPPAGPVKLLLKVGKACGHEWSVLQGPVA